MARKGRDFEIEYASLYELDSNKYKVESPGKIYDRVAEKYREIDVLINFKDKDGNNRFIAVECRDRKNGEDIKSIEQLIKKKEDMCVDKYVVVSKYKFTPSAIKKANHYGVIIENAQLFNKSNIEEIEKDFFCDIFYIIVKIKELNFLLNGEKISLKELLKRLDFIESMELLYSLNNDLFINFDFNIILDQFKINRDAFFDKTKEHNAIIEDVKYVKEDIYEVLKKYNIKAVYYRLEIKPFRLSLPLNKSISIFTVEGKLNKSFNAVFGDKNENVTIGYINNERVVANANLKPRKYHRIIGGYLSVNTIFKRNIDVDFQFENEKEILLNQFDFEEVL